MAFEATSSTWNRNIHSHITKLTVADKLAQVLQDGLRENFAEATVEWVDCPDLTKAPFNFIAPGLCGNPALIEIGGVYNMFPFLPGEKKTWAAKPFAELLQNPGDDRSHDDTFVLGAGICPCESNTNLNQIIMNTAYMVGPNGDLLFCNKSRFASVNAETGAPESKKLPQPTEAMCGIYGNFFISEGKPGPVLRVTAKKRTGLEFVEAMQSALSREYPLTTCDEQQIVGLGGTFIVHNTKVKIHLMPELTKPLITRKDVHDWLRYYEIDAPVIAVGTILSTDRQMCITPEHKWLGLWYTTTHFHAYSYRGQGGHYHTDVGSSDTVDYLGYFYPAEKIHRVNSDLPWKPMPDFSYVKSCW